MFNASKVLRFLETLRVEEKTTLWFFHMVPPEKKEWIEEKGYLEGKYGISPLSFSLGSQEGIYVEHIVARRRTVDPNYTYADFIGYNVVYAIPYSFFKQENYPLKPVFYSVSLRTHEVKYPDYHISWYKLLSEMEIWIPPGYRVPLKVCEEVTYYEMMDKLSQTPELYELDRKITKLFYDLLRPHYFWTITTYSLPNPEDLKPEEKEKLRKLCDRWNSFASELTGITCPPDIHEREYR